MRQKKTILSAFLLLGLGLSGLKAQNTLLVNEKSGTKTSFALSGIRKLTFPAGSITVTKKDLSSATFALSDISYLNFNILTTNISLLKDQGSKIKLYPNPAADQLQINYESLKAGESLLEIRDIQGKVLRQQCIISQSGTNQAIINVAELPAGFYICILHNGSKMETIKFLKN